MAKLAQIRKNNITGQWEHYVSQNGLNYWSPGIVGNDNIIIQPPSSASRDDSGNLNSFEYNTNYIVSELLTKPAPIDNNDIVELIDHIEYAPTIGVQPTDIYTNALTSFLNESLNVGVSIKKKLNSQKINYNWNFANKLISTSSIATVNVTSPGILTCNIIDNFGNSLNIEPVNISIVDPNKNMFLNHNLVKNGDFKNNLDNWSIIRGNPEIFQDWNNVTQTGYIANWDYSSPAGPNPNTINSNFSLKDGFMYPMGGTSSDSSNNQSELIQTIDLTSISDLVDRNVIGADNLYGQVFAWLGNAPSQDFYSTGATKTAFHGQIFDKVYIFVEMENTAGEIINNSNWCDNPLIYITNSGMYLRAVDYYIPIGVRKINLRIRFIRNQNYPIAAQPMTGTRWTNWDTKTDQYDYRQFSAASFINMYLTNDRINSQTVNNVLNNNPSLFYTDEYNIYRVKTINEVYSSLIDKINDSIKLLITSDSQTIYNYILESNWFRLRFTLDEIQRCISCRLNNSDIANDQILINAYDKRMQTYANIQTTPNIYPGNQATIQDNISSQSTTATPAAPNKGYYSSGILKWTIGANTTNYDLYFGTNKNNLTKVVINEPCTQNSNCKFTPEIDNINATTIYYWRVVAKNSKSTSSSPIWNFITHSNSHL